jgi:hypothetical protein
MMTVPHALTVAAEVCVLTVMAGSVIVLICSLGMLAALKMRRMWYRWSARREMFRLDHVSLESLARMGRDDR